MAIQSSRTCSVWSSPVPSNLAYGWSEVRAYVDALVEGRPDIATKGELDEGMKTGHC
jgi:hypothetical protein